MKNILLFISVLLCCLSRAQPPKGITQEIIVQVEEDASFPGGRNALNEYLYKNMKYPKKDVEGKCYIRFVVDEQGVISDVKIIRGIVDCPECDAEAIRLVQNMPHWIPAKLNHAPVKSTYNMPIQFRRE